jgi:KUP system potassium uptake protein
VVGLGIFGAATFYGDGMITPAISVLSAVEGLAITTPMLTPFVAPLTLVILIGLFSIQRHGTARVGVLRTADVSLVRYAGGARGD